MASPQGDVSLGSGLSAHREGTAAEPGGDEVAGGGSYDAFLTRI